MKNLFLILILFSSCISERSEQANIETKYTKIISDPTNKLKSEIENLEIEYTVFGCACPNWIKTEDNFNNDTNKNYMDLHFYIEPADVSLRLPIYFDAFRHRLKVTGQFYDKEDYPQGTIEQEEPLPKGRVFRYSKIQVIENPNFKSESKIETLTLSYNAISCTCAQWSETKYNDQQEKKEYYYLEPDNKYLVKADSLWNGVNFPLQIQVTGQLVSPSGFPFGFNSTKGEPEAGKVFKYSKIKVLKNGED